MLSVGTSPDSCVRRCGGLPIDLLYTGVVLNTKGKQQGKTQTAVVTYA